MTKLTDLFLFSHLLPIPRRKGPQKLVVRKLISIDVFPLMDFSCTKVPLVNF